jgi:hypothetical protein
MTTKRVIAALVISLAVLMAVGGVVLAIQPTALTLSAYQQQQQELVVDSGLAPVTAAVSSSSAAAAADALLARTDDANVLHGVDLSGASLGPRTVWIVLYKGGVGPPSGGPIGATPVVWVVDMTGVVIDDQTGEVLRSFGIAHQQ